MTALVIATVIIAIGSIWSMAADARIERVASSVGKPS